MAKPKVKRLKSAHEVIEHLGGVAKVAKLAGCVEGAAYNWRSYGRFPPRLHWLMTRELEKLEAIALPRLWQQQRYRQRQRAA